MLALLLAPWLAGCQAVDADDDGYAIDVDCDDADPAVHPDAEEVCNERDDDCDSTVDYPVDALYFDDPTDTIEIADHAALDMDATGTIEAWVWLEQGGLVFNKWVASQEDKQLQMTDGGAARGWLWKGQATDYIHAATPGEACALETWCHVAFVWDDTEARMYVDGVELASETDGADPWDHDGAAYIGNHPGRSAKVSLRGYIADVRISTDPRYEAGFEPAPSLADDDTTAALYPLDEGTGTTAFDATPTGNDGTLEGPVWITTACR